MPEADATSKDTSESDTAAKNPDGALMGTRRAALGAAAAATAGFLADQVLEPDRAEATEEVTVNGVPGPKILLPGLEELGLLPKDVVTTGAVGFEPSVIWLDTTPEYYGAKGDGTTNDTEAFQKASEAVKAKGGVVRVSAKEYIAEIVLESRVKWRGRGAGATIIRPPEASAATGVFQIPAGPVVESAVEDMTVLPNENNGQWAFYIYAQEAGAEKTGGLWNARFRNLEIGRNYAEKGKAGSFTGGGFKFLAGSNGLLPIQSISFENVRVCRANTGAYATASRCLVAMGQCNKFDFDGLCYWNGEKPSSHVGTNIEISRPFEKTSTLEKEAAAKATTIEVVTAAGLAKHETISIGEGNQNELAVIEEIVGKVVTLKSKLVYEHAAGVAVRLLTGASAPANFLFRLGAIQNAELGVLVDQAECIEFYGVDWEQLPCVLRARGNTCAEINLRDAHLSGAGSEGTGYATGKATVGSEKLTAVEGAWTAGEKISGPGIPPGTKVKEVIGGTELVLEAVGGGAQKVEANGTEGSSTIPLARGGEGLGYIAKYEEGAQGEADWYSYGIVDRGVVNESVGTAISGGRVGRNVGSRLASWAQTSSGTSISGATGISINTVRAREYVFTNAATTIKNLYGQQATGETLVVRATVAKTKLETGGNLLLGGKASLELEAGECATFIRTDYGPHTWVLVK
jgi:hypothetical protein